MDVKNLRVIVLGFCVAVPFYMECGNAQAKCLFPVEDGGVMPSRPNLHGNIIELRSDHMTIKLRKSGNSRLVKFTKNTKYVTAFDGDFEPKALVKGLEVWAWNKNCSKNSQEAGYIQV